MRFFGVVGAYKATPPEKALWRVSLDLALGAVKRFEYPGGTVPASMLWSVGWTLYGRSDMAGVIQGFSIPVIAGDARISQRSARAALTVLRRLHVVKMERPKRRASAVWRMNLGGLDWPTVRERVKRDSSAAQHAGLSAAQHAGLKGYNVGHDVRPAGEKSPTDLSTVAYSPTRAWDDDGEFVFRDATDPRAFEADEGGD